MDDSWMEKPELNFKEWSDIYMRLNSINCPIDRRGFPCSIPGMSMDSEEYKAALDDYRHKSKLLEEKYEAWHANRPEIREEAQRHQHHREKVQIYFTEGCYEICTGDEYMSLTPEQFKSLGVAYERMMSPIAQEEVKRLTEMGKDALLCEG